jgi:hypothetical protein
MTTILLRAGATALALAALAAPATAQTFSYADEKAKEELAKSEGDAVEWKAAAQAGLIITAGNSRMTALSGGLNASRKQGKNKVQLEGGVAYARSSIFLANDLDGDMAISEDEIERPTTTTNRGWATKARYDRFLSERDSLYGAALAAADEPAGKEFVGGGQLGYSRVLVKSEAHALLVEAGYDFSYENPVVGAGDPIHSLRLFAGYTGKLDGDTGLEGSVETLLNGNTYSNATGKIEALDDTRVTARLALTTQMFEDLSFRFACEEKFDNAPSQRPPFGALPYADGYVPLADKLDTKIEASLILSFL